jgi:hypothetical protein
MLLVSIEYHFESDLNCYDSKQDENEKAGNECNPQCPLERVAVGHYEPDRAAHKHEHHLKYPSKVLGRFVTLPTTLRRDDAGAFSDRACLSTDKP